MAHFFEKNPKKGCTNPKNYVIMESMKMLWQICFKKGMNIMPILLKFDVGDTLEMKKSHPCAKNSNRFKVLRVGSDIRIVCENCGRDLTVPRIKLEKNIKRVIAANGEISK